MADLHPAGPDFVATIVDHTFRTSKNKGTLSFAVAFQTEHGTVYGDFYLTEKAAESTIEKIRNMGWTGDDLAELQDGTLLKNHEVRISVEHDTFEGVVRAKVGFVNPIDYVYQPGFSHDGTEAALKAKMFNALAKKVKKEDKIPF